MAIEYQSFVAIRISIVPVRAKEREQAEMVSQLLWGEVAGVISETARWFEIVSADGYRGWIDRKMVCPSRVSFMDAVYIECPVVKTAFAAFVSTGQTRDCCISLWVVALSVFRKRTIGLMLEKFSISLYKAT